MLQQQVYRLFNHEIEHWQLAKDKYADLASSVSKRFHFGDFSIDVACNPARMRSTLADVRQRLERMRSLPNNSLSAAAFDDTDKKCFLCAELRPKEQQAVELGDFEILVNPYPIFPMHFTIAHKCHTPQLIVPYFADFLNFAKNLPDFAIFYNGANCGASAPFHAHFQAAEKRYFNVIKDYATLNTSNFDTIEESDVHTLKSFKNYLRKAFVISTTDEEMAKAVFIKYFEQYIEDNMINVIGCFDDGRYTIFVFPRKKFRPTQFYESDENKQLAISPASVEMSGCFVTIFKEHFDRMTKAEVMDIYKQIS